MPKLKTAAEDDLNSHALDLENRLFYRFSLLVGRHVRFFSTQHLRKHKLSTHNWLVLTVIGRFAPISPSEIADHTLSVRRDKISRVLDQLVRQELVVRKSHDGDRRRIVLTLSEKGRHVCDDLEVISRRIEVGVLDSLSELEREIVPKALSKIERSLRKILREI